MEVHEDETIAGCHLVDPDGPIEHRRYRRCRFERLTVSVRPGETPLGERPVVRDVQLEQCRSPRAQVALLGVVFEDVVVDGFDGRVSAQHCAFRRVVLRGRFGQDLIVRADMGPIDAEYWSAYPLDNERHHDGVEFTIDVSGATFENAMIRGVPPSSIRIDRATEAVITHESIAGGHDAFAEAELVGTVGHQIRRALAGDLLDHLVVVPAGSPTAAGEGRLVARLHEAGLALP